jgi:hypothetical protein
MKNKRNNVFVRDRTRNLHLTPRVIYYVFSIALIVSSWKKRVKTAQVKCVS